MDAVMKEESNVACHIAIQRARIWYSIVNGGVVYFTTTCLLVPKASSDRNIARQGHCLSRVTFDPF